MRTHTRTHARTYARSYMLAHTRIRALARARLACVGERYAVPRGAIRRITGRDTPYLFLTLPTEELKNPPTRPAYPRTQPNEKVPETDFPFRIELWYLKRYEMDVAIILIDAAGTRLCANA